MSDFPEENNEHRSLTPKEDRAKTHALIAYALMVGGLFTGGLLWIIGGIWAIVKREDAVGTLFEDHYTNIITTFWWGLGWSVIGLILLFIFIGYFILIGIMVWSIYRLVKGLARISSNKSFDS
ncbi:MAG: hypothetical protein P1U57_07820 [Oleibacter sp.]|nr:hypothetical protein [Thalassolituus sp.]